MNKKILALILMVVMAFTMVPAVSAVGILVPEKNPTTETNNQTDYDVVFGDNLGAPVVLSPGDSSVTGFLATDFNPDAFLVEGDDKYSVYAEGSVTNAYGSIIVTQKNVSGKDKDGKTQKGVLVSVKCSVAKASATLTEQEIKTTIYVTQASKVTERVRGKMDFSIRVKNATLTSTDGYMDASGNYRLSASKDEPIIDQSVFDEAGGNRVTITYPKYTLTFPRTPATQPTINLKADIGTIVGDAVASISFANGVIRNAMEVEIPTNSDKYADGTVYVYRINTTDYTPVMNSEPIVGAADGAVVRFTLPAGGALGTYAAFTQKIEAVVTPGVSDTTTKPSIPETGAGNLDMIFAVVILAACGALVTAGVVSTKLAAKKS